MIWKFKQWLNPNSVKYRIERHMNGDCSDAQSISHPIHAVERVGVQLALDKWLQAAASKSAHFGCMAQQWMPQGQGLSYMVTQQVMLAPVERERLKTKVAGDLDCVTRGIFLLHHQNHAIVVMVNSSGCFGESLILELLARERQIAQTALDALLAEAKTHNCYQGKIISLLRENPIKPYAIHYHDLPPTPRDALVLPEKIMKVIESNVLGMHKHGDLLRRAGRSTRYGMLLHGRPGTGKTLAARYLAQACKGYTVVLVNNAEPGLIRHSCMTARLLAPSLVILEDVDLVAEERSSNLNIAVMRELLDEMDGFGTENHCIFLLTTNRPEVLEPALAGRPGRIDQAVEFPLPDAECRQRLFELYGQGLDLSWIELDRWVEQTDGVSPAFIKEVLRKATLIAAERGERSEPMRIQNKDFDQALQELVHFGGELTQRLLGYRN
jgi:hypothetical protein